MADDAIRIAITPEAEHHDEARWITAILDAGWDWVHLRHPGASRRDIKRIIEDIPQRYHSRLRLHGHMELVYEFNIGGLHLNSRCPVAPSGYFGPVSRSCHSIDELGRYQHCDYLTLSPIYDSVSKSGYRSAFTPAELAGLPDRPVIALGGIVPERLEELSRYRFAGFAVLGYLWKAETIDELRYRLNQFELIK